jgi:c-di-GMP-binding flagellar brake protein YcgR
MQQVIAASARIQPQVTDRRRFRRVPVMLLGRYMLQNRQEYPCQTVNISPGGALLIAPVRGGASERVVVYLEHLGRLEGEITRYSDQGFAFCFAATTRKRDKLASQLTWLANRDMLGLPEDRRHERVVPVNPVVTIKLDSGRELVGRLIDVSMSGAAIALEPKLPTGTSVVLGRTPGKVVRNFQGGIGVQFLLSLSPDRFDENLVL